MKIDRVEYRRLKTFASYENETFGASAVVEDGETAGIAMEKLKEFVEEFFTDSARNRDEEMDLKIQVHSYRAELKELDRSIESAKARWQEAKAFLIKHGIDAEQYEPPPF